MSLTIFLFCLIGIPAMVLLILRAPGRRDNPFVNFSGGIKDAQPVGVNAGKTGKGVLHSPVPATDYIPDAKQDDWPDFIGSGGEPATSQPNLHEVKRKIYEAIKRRMKP